MGDGTLYEQLFGFRRLEVGRLENKLLGSKGQEGVYSRAETEEIDEQLQRLKHGDYDEMPGLPRRLKAKLPGGVRASTFYRRTDTVDERADVAVLLCRLIGLYHEAALYFRR